MVGGRDDYNPEVTYKHCQIFSEVISQESFGILWNPLESGIYTNFLVFSGNLKFLDKATITERWQKLVT